MVSLHDMLMDVVVSKGGVLLGSYVREWRASGAPLSEDRVNDVDCIFTDPKLFDAAKVAVSERWGPILDGRVRLPINDFFCNCWSYDGEFKVIPAGDKIPLEEHVTLTERRIARCINPWHWVSRMPHRVRNLQNFGWVFQDHLGRPLTPSIHTVN